MVEPMPTRVRGVDYNSTDFNHMVSFCKSLDELCQKGQARIILSSKKANDWDKILESDYLDLRNFEALGLSLSQNIFICQQLSNFTINWPSTFGLWLMMSSKPRHLYWLDDRDVSIAQGENALYQPNLANITVPGIRD